MAGSPPPFPVSDHCDGRRFYNSSGLQARSFADLPRWWWQQIVHRQGTRWPKNLPPPRQVQLPAAVPPGRGAVTFIGHSTFLLQFDGLTVLTDPMFAARGVTNVVELDWWQTHRHGAELEITCTPAQHFAARSPWDRCRTLWGGFALRTSHGSVYFCGDSGWGSHFAEIGKKFGPLDLALLPIGAYEPRWFMTPVHVDPDEAVRAHLAVRSRRSLGMHFGTFQLTDEAIDAPLHALAAARTAHGIAPEDFSTLDFGETRIISLSQRKTSA